MAPHVEENGLWKDQFENGKEANMNVDEVGISSKKVDPSEQTKKATVKAGTFPQPPKFEDPYEERKYLKGRLAAAFRIFGKYGWEEGVAGHITVRVSSPL